MKKEQKEKQILKRHIMIMMAQFISARIQITNKPVSARDFDCWISGIIAGMTYPGDADVSDILAINAKEIVDFVVQSDLAKSLGVTGTEKEFYKKSKLS